MDYITIDFETANENMTSGCSLGIIAMENGQVLWEKYSLINPEEPFSYQNYLIHGISEDMVDHAPTFPVLWEEIKDDFKDSLVFAHNAVFDIKVLKSMLEKYNLEAPSIKFGCTLKIAQKVFKGEVLNCRLNNLSNFLEVDHNHHNALSDAFVCTAIIERAIKCQNVATVSELYDALDLRFGVYNKNTFTGSGTKHKENGKAPSNPLKNKIFCLSGKGKKHTRNEYVNFLTSLGAFNDKGLSRATSYFVSMTNTPKSKTLEALKLIADGVRLEIINEDTLIEMIEEANEKN